MKKTKKHKPSGLDVYLKYVCPNGDCLDVQWITLKESQTKNYKIVCDCCGKIYRPRRVKKVDIIFEDEQTKTLPRNKEPEQINTKFLDDAVNTLVAFGFTKQEASDMIMQEWKKTGTTNPATLVKLALDFFGGKNG